MRAVRRASPAAEAPDEALAGSALLSALRAGGLILYFRHTSTDFGQNDDQMTGYEDCARQRNLTEPRPRRGARDRRGHSAAAHPGRRRAGESVLPHARDRAADIRARARRSAVRGGPASDDGSDRYAALRRLLSTAPASGTVLAIASHGNPFRAVAGTPYLAEGEAAVVRPLGAAGFRVIARIPKDGWSALETP